MPEIKRELIKLSEGEIYTAGEEDYIITVDHTLMDVLRWTVAQGADECEFNLALRENGLMEKESEDS